MTARTRPKPKLENDFCIDATEPRYATLTSSGRCRPASACWTAACVPPRSSVRSHQHIDHTLNVVMIRFRGMMLLDDRSDVAQQHGLVLIAGLQTADRNIAQGLERVYLA